MEVAAQVREATAMLPQAIVGMLQTAANQYATTTSNNSARTLRRSALYDALARHNTSQDSDAANIQEISVGTSTNDGEEAEGEKTNPNDAEDVNSKEKSQAPSAVSGEKEAENNHSQEAMSTTDSDELLMSINEAITNPEMVS